MAITEQIMPPNAWFFSERTAWDIPSVLCLLFEGAGVNFKVLLRIPLERTVIQI